jgi:hypothetical protein
MQYDDQGSPRREIRRKKAEHPQIARIGAELGFLTWLCGNAAENYADCKQYSAQGAAPEATDIKPSQTHAHQ